MKITPFDDLSLIGYDPTQREMRSILHNVVAFSNELRLRYLRLLESADIVRESMDRMKTPKNQGVHTLTTEELLTQQYETDTPVLAYQDFIGCLNIHGRVLNKNGITIPLYHRIRFYRNKMIEHWDEYIDKSCSAVSGWTAISGKIVIPYHSSKANRPADGKPLWETIVGVFKNYGIDVPFTWNDTISYERYTEFMWQLLEKIDPYLQTDKKHMIISDELIDYLYDYAMPVPFLDGERYCIQLQKYLETEVNKRLKDGAV